MTFRYSEDGPTILDDVTVSADPGEFVALVGPSGSGKSTVLRLLRGFETPEAGTVSFDDKDLGRLDVHAVRRQLGIVMQDTRALAGSLFDIIGSGASITLDEAWGAARAAGLEDDIKALPMEMHTMISVGASNISGGQRQRLKIARARVHRPRMLLFDEATSALDNRTQAIVTASLDQLQVTRIVVAHRLSTIENADRIYVIDAGKVVQSGTFASLREEEGLFARLMARQLV